MMRSLPSVHLCVNFCFLPFASISHQKQSIIQGLACHPCARAKLIFSVSFQFNR